MAKKKKAAKKAVKSKPKTRRSGFQPGKSGNPNGRPKGTLNKVTIEARKAASEIVDDPDYRKTLLARALSGKLNPTIEAMLWHYAKGKPKETLEINSTGELVLNAEANDALETYAGILAAIARGSAKGIAGDLRSKEPMDPEITH